ncbi:MAG TPA: ABC transporter substrate-binding protein [Acidobacteriota bacterium]|nr:ABC transporter substrate-binding protein [Acidobacteriota bacterium]
MNHLARTLLTIAAVLLASVGSSAERVTMSSTNITAFDLDQIVALSKGFFAKENIEFEPTYMQPELVVKALLAGTVDMAKSGTHFGLIAAARGGELKVIGASTYGYAYQVISQPQFKTLADLKGQKIAGASLASITTTIFKDVMQRQGIPPSAYTILSIGGSPERFQAVSSGQVAASLAEAPPYNFRSIDAGKRVLLNYSDDIKNLQYGSYFASSKSLAQMRPVLVRFMRAISQAMRWLNDPANEREAVRVMMERLKIDETVAARTFKFMVPENRSYRGEAMIDPVGLSEMIRLLASDNLIPEKRPWEVYVDAGFLPVAAK